MGLRAVGSSGTTGIPIQTTSIPRVTLSKVQAYCTAQGISQPSCVLSAREAFTDASRSVAAVDGDAVQTLADITGNGFPAAQATAALKPILRANGINGLYPGLDFSGAINKRIVTAGASGALTPAGFATGVTMYTVASSGPASSGFNAVQVLSSLSSGTNYISTKLTNQVNDSFNGTNPFINLDQNDMTGVYFYGWDGVTATLGLNGAYASQAVAGTPVNTGELVVGNINAGGFAFATGLISDVYLFAGKHTQAQADAIGAIFYADLAMQKPGFLAIGDSLTRGFGLTAPTVQNWFNKMMSDLGATLANCCFQNQAVDGETLATMASDVATPPSNGARLGWVSPVRGNQNIVFIWGGTNDISPSVGDVSAAQAFTNLTTLCALYRSATTKVVILNCITRNPTSANRQRQLDFNTLIASGGSSIADIVVDLAANTHLGSATAYTDTVYYQADGIHLTEQGEALVAFIVKQALASYGATPILAAAQRPLNPPQNVLAGTTAGAISYAMPKTDSFEKKFVAQANGYENNTAVNQTITFPKPFAVTPVVTANSTGLTVSATTTTLTITAPNNTTLFSGLIQVEGF